MEGYTRKRKVLSELTDRLTVSLEMYLDRVSHVWLIPLTSPESDWDRSIWNITIIWIGQTQVKLPRGGGGHGKAGGSVGPSPRDLLLPGAGVKAPVRGAVLPLGAVTSHVVRSQAGALFPAAGSWSQTKSIKLINQTETSFFRPTTEAVAPISRFSGLFLLLWNFFPIGEASTTVSVEPGNNITGRTQVKGSTYQLTDYAGISSGASWDLCLHLQPVVEGPRPHIELLPLAFGKV